MMSCKSIISNTSALTGTRLCTRVTVVFFVFLLAFAGISSSSTANKFDWVITSLEMPQVGMGQRLDDVKRSLPNLDFGPEQGSEGSKPFRVGVLVDPEHPAKLLSGLPSDKWAIAYFFAKSNNSLYLIRGTFPPHRIAEDFELIDSIFLRLKEPVDYRIRDSDESPDSKVEEYLWGSEGVRIDRNNADEDSVYFYMMLVRDQRLKHRRIVSIEYFSGLEAPTR